MGEAIWGMRWARVAALAGILVLTAGLMMGGVSADNGKGPKAKGKAAGQGPQGKNGPDRAADQRQRYFNEQQRAYIQDYYAAEYQRGNCPPGLAKKGNGCRPPGQAKKWAVGRPLPREVVFHDLPPEILVELGPPPSHHRFVRVAQDILLIAVGTGMVVDAIEDLKWEFGH